MRFRLSGEPLHRFQKTPTFLVDSSLAAPSASSGPRQRERITRVLGSRLGHRRPPTGLPFTPWAGTAVAFRCSNRDSVRALLELTDAEAGQGTSPLSALGIRARARSAAFRARTPYAAGVQRGLAGDRRAPDGPVP